MASSPDALKPYIIAEFAALGIEDPATLEKFATALSKAVHAYITSDVEVKSGISVATSGGPGATNAPGKLF